MQIFTFVFGIACLINGLLLLFSDKFNARLDAIRQRNESEIDRRLFSKKSRYFQSRYLTGFWFTAVGIMFLVFWWLTFK